jgi:hypothetical protein
MLTGRHDNVTFDFLGYTFKPRAVKGKDGTMFTNFSPAISRAAATAIRQQIRRMRFHLRSDLSFADIAKMINAKAGAWAAYYGRFNPWDTVNVLFHIDRYLVRWAPRKYKHLRRAPDEQQGPWPTSNGLGQDSSPTGGGRSRYDRLPRLGSHQPLPVSARGEQP